MKSERIFIGNIMKCTKYEEHMTFSASSSINGIPISRDIEGYTEWDDKIFKENAILIKLKSGGYVDLDNINSLLSYLKFIKDSNKDGFILGSYIMDDSPHELNCLFVDEDSLKPYNTEQKNISVHQLKKQK